MKFILDLSKNINDIQLYVGEFQNFVRNVPNDYLSLQRTSFYNHLEGIEHPRDWMFKVKETSLPFLIFGKNVKRKSTGKKERLT